MIIRLVAVTALSLQLIALLCSRWRADWEDAQGLVNNLTAWHWRCWSCASVKTRIKDAKIRAKTRGWNYAGDALHCWPQTGNSAANTGRKRKTRRSNCIVFSLLNFWRWKKMSTYIMEPLLLFYIISRDNTCRELHCCVILHLVFIQRGENI